jgi:hypothetical protein
MAMNKELLREQKNDKKRKEKFGRWKMRYGYSAICYLYLGTTRKLLSMNLSF